MSPNPPTIPSVLAPAEVSRRLGISASSVRRLMVLGELPVSRIGRRVLIEERAVVALLERRAVATQRAAA